MAVIPGGVTSSVRAGGLPHPLYFERGAGARLIDVDGHEYVDFVLGYGPLLLGHCPPKLVAALRDQLDRGLTFGAQHPLEPEVARLLVDLIPGAEQVIFGTTGSEAVAAALRIARAATRRSLIVKFEGHYHGWHDGVFASVGVDPSRSGPSDLPNPVPATNGIPAEAGANLRVAQWNDLDSVRSIFEKDGLDVAAVICEPVAVNGGVIPALPGFLEALRALCSERGAALIFDEVITGFRVALGGSQERYGVKADLAIFAKAMAGGIPLAAVTGSRAWMSVVRDGLVSHNGTFNGNPLALRAASLVLTELAADRAILYPRMEELATRLAAGLAAASPRLTIRQVGPILGVGIDEGFPIRSTRDRNTGSSALYVRFVEALLHHGVHTTPRGLWYLSTAHTDADVDRAIEAAVSAAEDVLI